MTTEAPTASEIPVEAAATDGSGEDTVSVEQLKEMLKALQQKVMTLEANITDKSGDSDSNGNDGPSVVSGAGDKYVLKPIDIKDIEKPESMMGMSPNLKCGSTG